VSEPCALSATALARMIRRRELSCEALLSASLARIEQVQPALNPFAFVFAEAALAAARAADAAVRRGAPLGPLHGLPVAFKDFTPTAGHITTRGSACFEGDVAESDPVIVRRFKAAGAILIGKTTTPEFAHSSFTRSPLWGHTRNPWDARKTCGGSSGGAAVAVTTGCVALAEGTDMGGSVRIPAALSGCVGLKPSLGRIPMDILPSCFDDHAHFGPLARTVEDAALFLRVAEGPDEADINSQPAPMPLPDRLDGDLRGLRLALCTDLGFYAVNAEVEANLLATARVLAEAGAVIEEVELDWGPELVEAWLDWWGAFQAASFARLLPEWRERMDPELVALIEAGQRLSALDLLRIDQLRSRQWRSLAAIFARCDALLCPTTALPAPPIEARDSDFELLDDAGRLHGLDMTCPFNLLGQCPALSLPSGHTAAGLPTAIQIVGRRFDDPTALRIGAAIEQGRPWRHWTPENLI